MQVESAIASKLLSGRCSPDMSKVMVLSNFEEPLLGYHRNVSIRECLSFQKRETKGIWQNPRKMYSTV